MAASTAAIATTTKEIDMRRIVAGLFMSVDGVVESPEQWQGPYFDAELAQAVQEVMTEADTMLLGRRTYQEFAAFWPNQPADDPIANYMNTTPKLVASTTLDTVEWQRSTLLGSDLAEELIALKQRPGRNLNVTGSITLVRWLLRAGLLDELGLLVHPVVVGKGRRLFEEGDPQLSLELAASRPLSSGVVSLSYRPTATARR
jgi:dihydrofolate reductase